MLRWAFIGLFLCISYVSKAQLSSNQRQKKINVTAGAIIPLDTLSIAPQSVKVIGDNGLATDTSLYKIDYAKAILYWKGSEEKMLTIRYTVRSTG